MSDSQRTRGKYTKQVMEELLAEGQVGEGVSSFFAFGWKTLRIFVHLLVICLTFWRCSLSEGQMDFLLQDLRKSRGW